MSIPEHVIDSPAQADAVGQGAVPVGVPEGQQSTPLALRNQLESIVGDLRIAFARLGELPPEAIEPGDFSALMSQYATLMDTAGQLTVRLNELGPMIGEDLGLAKEINRLQEEIELYISAVESSIAKMLAMAYGDGNGEGRQWAVQMGPAVIDENGQVVPNNNGAQVARRNGWMRWGIVLGGLLLVAGGTYYYYQQRGRVTPAF